MRRPERPAGRPLSSPAAYGTIGLMSSHRVRLTDEDIDLIVAALKARAAMCRGLRRHRVERLAERLAEGGTGNPRWRLDNYSQTHEDELDNVEA
jgi:hypothetical protein